MEQNEKLRALETLQRSCTPTTAPPTACIWTL